MEARVAELIAALRAAERELQELTGGQPDAVVAVGGGAYLFEAVQQDLRDSEAEQRRHAETRRAVLDALPAHVALVDGHGVILEVNEAWRRFGSANVLASESYAVGASYLEVCDRATGDCSEEADAVATGVRAVLRGELPLFSLEYPCHAPDQRRWFRLMVTPVGVGAPRGAVIMHVDVSERRSAEEALRESERHYRMLFEGNPQPMWVFDRETLRFLAVNDAAVAKYGYSRTQFEAMTLREIRPAEDVAELEQRVTRLGEETVRQSIWRHRLSDGRIIAVEISSQPVEFAGRAARLVMATDVTERCAAETALRESEREQRRLAWQLDLERQRLVAAQAVAKVGSWETDITTLDVNWSEQTHRIFETDPLVFAASHAKFLGFVHPADRARVDAAFHESWNTQEVQSIEHRIVLADGRVKHVEERWRTVTDPGGRPLRAIGTIQDLTERRRAELALEESRERFRRVFLSAATGIAITDVDGRFLETNEAFRRMLGYDEDELRERTFSSLTHPDDLSHNLELVRDLLAGRRESFVLEKRYLAKGGETVWSRLSVSAQSDATGRVESLVAVAEDITQQRAAEEALRGSQALLRMASQVARFGAWAVDLRSGEITWSEAVRAIHEVPGDFVPDLEKGLDFYVPEHRERIRRAFESCAADGSPFDLELEISSATGRRVAVRSVGEAVRDEGGRIVRVQGAFQDVSERKAAEARERALSERLGATLESISDAFFTLDHAWRFSYLNRTAEELLERSRDELLGREIWQELATTDETLFETNCRRAMETRETVEFEVHYSPLDTWLGVRAYPTPDGLAVYLRDVTDKRRAREALRVSEERFRLMARATNDAIYDWNLVTDAVWWNEGFESLFGYSRDEVESTSASWKSRVHPDDYDRTVPVVESAIASGTELWSGEYRFRHKSGDWLYVLDRGYVIRDGSGKPMRMIGGMTDLTARRHAEERLVEQAALLDAAHEAIVVKDLEDRILFWSRGAERTYGWSAFEVAGRTSVEVLYGGDPAQIEREVPKLLADGQWQGEMRHLTRDGRKRVVDVSWTLVRGEDGKPKSVLSINNDVTERRNLEALLFRAQRLESIGTLAGGIAHDLNNVLAPILMSIELLREEETSEARLELMSTLAASAERGADMVRRVLSFARGMDSEKATMNLGSLGREVVKILRETFPKNVVLDLRVGDELWPISADATQMHQVLMNLCVNARDAMPAGGRVTVTIENVQIDETYANLNPDAQPGAYVLVKVADTGVGIAPEHHARLFEPFFTTKEPGRGTGLGLPTVHTIVRGHGGFVHVYSEVGKGSKFKVYLPATAAAADIERVALDRGDLPRGRGECVLVVDDEEGVRDVVRRTLERFGYRVLLATHGAEAVAIYAQHPNEVAVVLTDMSMPVMDGPTTILALQAIDPAVRIIGSSGLAANGYVAKAASSGVRQFVPKPYTAGTLLRALRQAIDEPA